jgi:hypothetical protein
MRGEELEERRGSGGGREYRTFNCPTGGVGAGKLQEVGGSLRAYINHIVPVPIPR